MAAAPATPVIVTPLTSFPRDGGGGGLDRSALAAPTAPAMAVPVVEASLRRGPGSTAALVSGGGEGGGRATGGGGSREGRVLPALGMRSVAEEPEADMSLTLGAGTSGALYRAAAEVSAGHRRGSKGSGGGGGAGGGGGRVRGVVDRGSAVEVSAMAAPAPVVGVTAVAVRAAAGSADAMGRGVSTAPSGRLSVKIPGAGAYPSGTAAAAAVAEGGRRDDDMSPVGSEVTDTSDQGSCSSGSSGSHGSAGHSRGSRGGNGSHSGNGSHGGGSHVSNGSSNSRVGGSRGSGGGSSGSGLLGGGTISTGGFGSIAKPLKVGGLFRVCGVHAYNSVGCRVKKV